MTRQIALSVRHVGRPVQRLVRPLRSALSIGAGHHCDLILDSDGVAEDHLMMIPGGDGVRLAALGSAWFTAGGRSMQLAAASDRGEIGVGPFTVSFRVITGSAPMTADAIEITPSSWQVHASEVPRPASGGPDATRDIARGELAARLVAMSSDVEDEATLLDIDPALLSDAALGASARRSSPGAMTDDASLTLHLTEDELIIEDDVPGDDEPTLGSLRVSARSPVADASEATATLISQGDVQRALAGKQSPASTRNGARASTEDRRGDILWAPARRPPRHFDVELLDPTQTPDAARNPLTPLMGVPRASHENRELPGNTALDGSGPTRSLSDLRRERGRGSTGRAVPPPPPAASPGALGPTARLVGELRTADDAPTGLPADTAPAGRHARGRSTPPPRPAGWMKSTPDPALVARPLLAQASMKLPWSVSADDGHSDPPLPTPVDDDSDLAPPRLSPLAFVMSLIRGPRTRGIREWIGRILGLSLVLHVSIVGWLGTIEVPERPVLRVDDRSKGRVIAAIFSPPTATDDGPTTKPPREEMAPPEPPKRPSPPKPPPPDPPEPIMMLPEISVEDAIDDEEPPDPEVADVVLHVAENMIGRSNLLGSPEGGPPGGPGPGSLVGIGGERPGRLQGGFGALEAPLATGEADGAGTVPRIAVGALGSDRRPRRRKPPVRPRLAGSNSNPSLEVQQTDKDAIHRALRGRRSRFTGCYELALERTQGALSLTRVVMHFIVRADGRPEDVKIEAVGGSSDSAFERCLTRAIQAMVFRRVLKERVPVRYPLTLRKGS